MRRPETLDGKPAARRRAGKMLCPGLVMLALSLILTPCALAGSGWQQQAPGSNATLTGIDFADAAHGWAVGYDPGSGAAVILATANAGATWTKQGSGAAEDLNDVTFVNATHGWAVGTGGIILATTSGGMPWSEQRPAAPIGSVSYSQDLNGVAFTDEAHGCAVGADGIITTWDGGATWSDPQWRDVWFNGVAFGDATHGWAVGNANGGGVILATADGGATWGLQATSTQDIHGVAFVDALRGWVVGDSGFIAATTDGGATWSMQDSGTLEWLDSVAFSDALHGWAVGQDGTILATSDGGGTWKGQPSGLVIQWLRDVAFVDSTHGWVAGGYYDKPSRTWGGSILVTATGGEPTPGPGRVTLSFKLSGLKGGAIKLGRKVTATLGVAPAGLTGGKSTLSVQKQQGTKWIKGPTASATLDGSASYGWAYKPTKKGVYRVHATITKSATHGAAATKWLSFKVK